jgi:metal-responsive CopG/Arc/MetJ family transcriptional regulator
MTPRRKLFAVRLDDDLLEGLDAVYQRDGAQPSEQVRRAVREWLERKGVLQTAKRGAQTPRKAGAVSQQR